MSSPKLVVADQQPLDPAVIAPAVADHLKIALYGRWCTRKTMQISSLIERYGANNVFIVSADKGLNTIGGSFDTTQRWEVGSIDELRKAYHDVANAIKGQPQSWVCLDGMTRVMYWVSDDEMASADEYARLIAEGQPHVGVPDKLKPYRRFVNAEGGVDMMKIYGVIGVDSKQLLNAWLRLSCNLYATYLEDESSSGGRTKGPPYVPDVPGQVGLKHLMSSFDYVMRCAFKDGGVTCQLDPSKIGLYYSRTRENRALSGELPKEIPAFNLAQFVDKVRGITHGD